MEIRKRLDYILREYIQRFDEKHDIDFKFAVQDDLTGVINFNDDLFFHISDIIYDIDNDLPRHLIIEWLNDSLDFSDTGNKINLQSYAAGMRYENLPTQSEWVKSVELSEVKDCYVLTDKNNVYHYFEYAKSPDINTEENIVSFSKVKRPNKPNSK